MNVGSKREFVAIFSDVRPPKFLTAKNLLPVRLNVFCRRLNGFQNNQLTTGVLQIYCNQIQFNACWRNEILKEYSNCENKIFSMFQSVSNVFTYINKWINKIRNNKKKKKKNQQHKFTSTEDKEHYKSIIFRVYIWFWKDRRIHLCTLWEK